MSWVETPSWNEKQEFSHIEWPPNPAWGNAELKNFNEFDTSTLVHGEKIPWSEADPEKVWATPEQRLNKNLDANTNEKLISKWAEQARTAQEIAKKNDLSVDADKPLDLPPESEFAWGPDGSDTPSNISEWPKSSLT